MQAGWLRGAGSVVVGWLIAGAALADVPGVINYQGRLVTATNLVNGTVSLVLRLYDAETGGTLRYADSNRVTVVDGLYATWLGDNTIAGTLTNALAQPQVWVELVVNGGRLSPRERLGSVPYALNANAAAGLSTVNPTFAGVVTAAGFAGDGSGLTALESARLTGPLTITPTPVRVGYIDDGGYFDDVAVAGNYAYVADSLVGLWIYNVSDPAHPVNVAHTNNGGSAQGVAVAGNYAYLANLHDGLRIYDVSDPAAPVAVGHIDDGGNALGVAVAGNCAYLANHGDGLRIYDVSDPAHPVSVGHANNGGIAKRVAVVDNYAYLANSSDGLRIYDVSDPAHPLNIAHTNNVGNAQGVAVAGNYAYLANWDDGVRIYDVSDPGFPVAVGHIDDGNNGFASGVAVKDGYAYLANHNGGLRIYASEFVANVAGTVSARGLVGNGGGLTNLSGTAIASGTVPDARLPANLARRDVGQTFTGSNTFNNALNRFTGNGAGLTALNAGNLTAARCRTRGCQPTWPN